MDLKLAFGKPIFQITLKRPKVTTIYNNLESELDETDFIGAIRI